MRPSRKNDGSTRARTIYENVRPEGACVFMLRYGPVTKSKLSYSTSLFGGRARGERKEVRARDYRVVSVCE